MHGPYSALFAIAVTFIVLGVACLLISIVSWASLYKAKKIATAKYQKFLEDSRPAWIESSSPDTQFLL